jgi:hypothetical protein
VHDHDSGTVRAGLARAKDEVICAIPMPAPPRGAELGLPIIGAVRVPK